MLGACLSPPPRIDLALVSLRNRAVDVSAIPFSSLPTMLACTVTSDAVLLTVVKLLPR